MESKRRNVEIKMEPGLSQECGEAKAGSVESSAADSPSHPLVEAAAAAAVAAGAVGAAIAPVVGAKRYSTGAKKDLGATGIEDLGTLQVRREDTQNRLLELTGIAKEDAEATGILTMSSSQIAAKDTCKQPRRDLHWDYVLKEMVRGAPSTAHVVQTFITNSNSPFLSLSPSHRPGSQTTSRRSTSATSPMRRKSARP